MEWAWRSNRRAGRFRWKCRWQFENGVESRIWRGSTGRRWVEDRAHCSDWGDHRRRSWVLYMTDRTKVILLAVGHGDEKTEGWHLMLWVACIAALVHLGSIKIVTFIGPPQHRLGWWCIPPTNLRRNMRHVDFQGESKSWLVNKLLVLVMDDLEDIAEEPQIPMLWWRTWKSMWEVTGKYLSLSLRVRYGCCRKWRLMSKLSYISWRYVIYIWSVDMRACASAWRFQQRDQ